MAKPGEKHHQPNPDDVAIGARIRAIRQARGMSQERLGKVLGVTFQQIQKYEKGSNRIGGSRMLQIAAALDTPVAAFFGTGESDADLAPVFDCSQSDSAFLRTYLALGPGTRAIARRLVAALRNGDDDLMLDGNLTEIASPLPLLS
ncbi:helix-turn-helix domain-containing protein [Kaistia nematophila]|uniref:Helix-turn-helix transcriptional regulator n=1 Tax=Kaistia nematophila TaxID=2994654 RepID=A0A9X3E4B0_9HYPH|nr:helix-turn-helix transcriptional regulator [Kaistia nematophila]MCX5571455.1 helix-turn-helix transcriptional regulator [Kaistia nematophila]